MCLQVLMGLAHRRPANGPTASSWAPYGFYSLANRAAKDLDTCAFVQYTFNVNLCSKTEKRSTEPAATMKERCGKYREGQDQP